MSVLKNAREAKKLGLGWIVVAINLPDGSTWTSKGEIAPEKALRIWTILNSRDNEGVVVDRSLKCTHGLNVPGHYFVLRKAGDTSRGIGYVEEAFAGKLESALGQLVVSEAGS